MGNIANLGIGIIEQFVLDFASRLGDWFGILGSGVGPQLDDKLFYWSDMFHYRRTNEFACDLFRRAVANGYDADAGRVDKDPAAQFGYEQGLAYALGWMTHIGTDVTGHPFVNEKSGGPYRLHWQRHHLVENHMDGFNVNARQGTDQFYNMYASSALHYWVQFRDEADHTPQYNYLLGTSTEPFPDPVPKVTDPTGPLPQYPTGVTSREYFQRNAIFDVDSNLPPALSAFILDTMKDTFYDRHTPDNNDQDGDASDDPGGDHGGQGWTAGYGVAEHELFTLLQILEVYDDGLLAHAEAAGSGSIPEPVATDPAGPR